MITFSTDGPAYKGRKRAHRSCSKCKRTKKKCPHGFVSETPYIVPSVHSESMPHLAASDEPRFSRSDFSDSGDFSSPSTVAAESTGTVPRSIEAKRRRRASFGRTSEANGDAAPTSEPADDSTFVGDLNAVAVLLRDRDSPEGVDGPDRDQVGVWVRDPTHGDSDHEPRDSTRRSPTRRSTFSGSQGTPLRYQRASPADRALQKYLTLAGSFDYPPVESVSALIEIYFTFFNPILPILDEQTFREAYKANAVPKVLLQALVLVAAKHSRSLAYLRLNSKTAPQPSYRLPLLSPRVFCKRVFTGLKALLNTNANVNRMTLIQVYTLMSLHAEGPNGDEVASINFGMAVHHAHTIGLQLERPDRDGEAPGARANLFWVLWALDRMHSALGGRPCKMNRDDNGIRFYESAPREFHLFWRIAVHLDRVIVNYRPTSKGEFRSMMAWEDVLEVDKDSPIKPSIMAVLELYYNAVAILSCRSNLGADKELFAETLAERQERAAARILSIMGQERPKDLPPLPVVPYALSLAMTVSYRNLKQIKRLEEKQTHIALMRQACEVLMELSATWWSAGAMARLGFKAIEKAEKMGVQNHHGHVTAETSEQHETGEEVATGPEVQRPQQDQEDTDMQETAVWHANDAGATETFQFPSLEDYFAKTDPLFGSLDALLEGYSDLGLPTSFEGLSPLEGFSAEIVAGGGGAEESGGSVGGDPWVLAF